MTTLAPQLVWFRCDLRTVDHAPLLAARAAGPVVGVVALDLDRFAPRVHDFPRLGDHLARFWLECVGALREELDQLGIPLLVREGSPEIDVPRAAEALGAASVHAHAEACTEERRAERAVRRRLAEVVSAELHLHDGMTMVLPDDLPMPIAEIPDVFTRFRRAVERSSTIRSPQASPAEQPRPALAGIELGELPPLARLGGPEPTDDSRAVMRFAGGTAAAATHLEAWMHRGGHIAHYKDTRNGMVEPADSSKFSPWLATGSLSPRTVAAEIRRFEAERGATSGTEWLLVEMLWRDYFRLVARRAGRDLFRAGGLRQLDLTWRDDADAQTDFDRWRRGQTGVPMVDASMRELDATGFMSNRGRQVVASFLTRTLGVDWRWGARWFESRLVDHDPASNWANWNYIAGVGNDAREFRWFNPWTQGTRYDGDAAHARRWLPELDAVDVARIHDPDPDARRGADYPPPMVDVHAASERVRVRYEAAGVGHDAPIGRGPDTPPGQRRRGRR